MSDRKRRSRRPQATESAPADHTGGPAPQSPSSANGQDAAAMPLFGAERLGPVTVWEIGNHRLAEQAEEMALQLECAKLTEEELPLGLAYKRYLDIVHRAVPFEHGTLYVTEWNSGRLTAVTVRGNRIELADQIRFARGNGLSAWVAQEGRAVIIPDPQAPADRRPFSDHALRAFLAFPLIQNGVVAGVLALARSDRTFTADEFARLGRLSETLATTMARLRREARLQELIYKDAATGLSNRHHFLARIEEELERGRQHGVEFSVALIELDEAGPVDASSARMVQSFTHRLQKAMRSCDMAASLDGHTFGLLLAGVDREKAAAIVARITRAVLHGADLPEGALPLRLRVGLASNADANQSVDALLRAAEATLERIP